MTQTRHLPKGELSVLNIGLDWADWLGTDTITLSEWTADAELILTRKQNTTTTTSCYVSGGILNKTYQITNKITTLDGKIDTRYVTIVIDNLSA